MDHEAARHTSLLRSVLIFIVFGLTVKPGHINCFCPLVVDYQSIISKKNIFYLYLYE